jgi:ABC-type transport system involved in cytochrome c biogenesis permease subunit
MNEILDLLPIPAERDLPAGQLEARRDLLVAALGTHAAHEPLARRTLRAARAGWLSLLGILALALAVVCSGVSGQHRAVQSDAVAVLAVTAAVAVAVAPAIASTPVRQLEARRH